MEDLGAESAPHIRGPRHAVYALGNTQNKRPHQQPDDVRVLAGGIKGMIVCGAVVVAHRHPRFHGIGDQTLVFQLQRRHMRRVADRFVHRILVFLDKSPVITKVTGQIVMHLGRAIGQRGLHIHDGGQFLDIHVYRLCRVARLFQAVGNYGSDRVAHVPHFALAPELDEPAPA